MNHARRGLTAAGAPVRILLITLIRLYRLSLSGLLGGQCRFEPSCSAYAEQAIRTRGAVVGSLLAGRRVLRCNPFGRPGLDPVPEPPSYDHVVRGPSEKARV
jgi:putative membrane protein insertion efficiency factor